MKLRSMVYFAALFALTGCIFKKSGDADCSLYCARMEKACPGTFGDNGEFDEDSCLDVCSDFTRKTQTDDAGDPIPFGDPVGHADSLECRVYHAENAAADPVHCAHAGPTGGGVCVDFTPTCAEFCVGSGANFVEFCANTEHGLPKADDCGAFCNPLVEGSPGDEFGASANCHLTWAKRAREMQDQSLCESAGPNSGVCILAAP